MAHALESLRSAVADCSEQDVRTDELAQALGFVERHLVRRFRKAFDSPDPMERGAATRQAYEAIAWCGQAFCDGPVKLPLSLPALLTA